MNKMSVRINGETFRTFDDLYKEEGFLADDEKAIIERKTAVFSQLIVTREKNRQSQHDI